MEIGIKEIALIALAAVLLFGTNRVPALTKSIAEAIKNIRGAFKDSEVIASKSR